jgi:hypothetical protein
MPVRGYDKNVIVKTVVVEKLRLEFGKSARKAENATHLVRILVGGYCVVGYCGWKRI